MVGPSAFDVGLGAENVGSAPVIASFAIGSPEIVRSVTAMTDKALKDRPDRFEQALAGYARSLPYGIEHGEENVSIAKSGCGIDPVVSRLARQVHGPRSDPRAKPRCNGRPVQADQFKWM